VGNAILSDIYPPERRGFAISAHISGGNVGTVLVPFVGLALIGSVGWQTTLVLREELTERDADLFTADVAIVQRLTEAEASIAARALPAQVREWLPRIAAEMVAVVGGQGLRWAMLAPTTIERRLLTSVARDGSAPAVT